jgi:hypothetical protein
LACGSDDHCCGGETFSLVRMSMHGGCIAVQKVSYVLGLVRLPVKTETNYGDVCWRRYLAKASATSLLGFFDENP